MCVLGGVASMPAFKMHACPKAEVWLALERVAFLGLLQQLCEHGPSSLPFSTRRMD